MNRNQYIVALTEGTPQMSKDLATRIIDALYAKGMDAKDFDAILYRLRRKMEREELAKLMEKATKETIGALVDELAAMRLPCPPMDACACSEASFFNELNLAEGKEYKAGDSIDVQILRTGKWKHERYGTFEVTTKSLSEMIDNFKAGVRGIKIFADEDHDPAHKALSEFKELYKKGKDQLWAKMKLTAKGAQLLNEGAYHYFSSEFARFYKDIESGKTYRNLLLGGGFTNRPVVKGMAPILASETGTDDPALGEQATADQTAILLLHSPAESMDKFLNLLDSLVGKETITASEKEQFEELWLALSEEQREIAEYKKTYADVMALKLAEDSEEETEEEDDEEGEGDDTVTPAADDTTGKDGKKTVAASEKKPAKKAAKTEAPLTLSEKEELQQLREDKRQLSHRENALRLSEANDQIEGMFDSDAVTLSPVSKQRLAQFAVSLSEKQEEKLWSILEDMKFVMLGELGMSKDEEGQIVLSENHPSVQKLMGAGYELSEAIDIAAEAMKLPRKKKVAKK